MAQKRPDLHFTKTLTATLSFATQRLLCNQRIGTDGSHVNFIFYHMMEFHHIHITNGNFLIKRLAGAAIVKFHFAIILKTGAPKFGFDFLVSGAGEWRNYGLIIQSIWRPSS